MADVSKNQADIIVTLAAGATKTIPRYGRVYHCLAVTTDGQVQIGLGYEPTEFLYAGVGEVLGPGEPEWREITLYNSGATSQTVRLKTAFGGIVDNRFIPASGAIPVSFTEPAQSNTLETTADQSVTASSYVDIAADTTRREIMISNLDTALSLRVRDTASTATAGTPLPPGATITLQTTAAVRVKNPNASGVSIAVNTLKQV